MNTLFGIEVRSSSIPLEHKVAIRKHKKRRNQSANYHARVQKKWTKRWGTRLERYAVLMNPKAFGLMGGETILLDPRDVVMLRGIV